MIAGGGGGSESAGSSTSLEMQPLGSQQDVSQSQTRPLLARTDSCQSLPYVEYAVVRPNVLGDPRHPDEGCYRQLSERDWLGLLDRDGRVTNPLHLCKVRADSSPNYTDSTLGRSIVIDRSINCLIDYRILIDRIACTVQTIFFAGIDPNLRSTVWPYLLGCYPFNYTSEQLAELRAQRLAEYNHLKNYVYVINFIIFYFLSLFLLLLYSVLLYCKLLYSTLLCNDKFYFKFVITTRFAFSISNIYPQKKKTKNLFLRKQYLLIIIHESAFSSPNTLLFVI